MDKRTLKSYLALCDEIATLEAEKQELIGGCIASTKITGLPVVGGSTSDPTGDIGVRVASVASELDKQRNRCISLRLEIEAVINGLGDSMDRSLMRKRYIEGKTWEQVAVEMNYSYRRVTQIHGKVLQEIK